MVSKQGYKDSNLEMTESESVALPFGDSPSFTCKKDYSATWERLQVLFLKNFYIPFQPLKFVVYLITNRNDTPAKENSYE